MEWLLYFTLVASCYMGLLLPGHGLQVLSSSVGGPGYQLIRDGYSYQQDCPTWFEPSRCSRNRTICKCGDATLGGIVQCNEKSKSSSLHLRYCMTSSYKNLSKSLYVGECPFSKLNGTDITKMYVPLPSEPSELNSFMCGSLNRTGLLCSKCEDGLGTALFSPSLECVPCLSNSYGWILYLCLILLPPTLFYVIVLLFQIRANSAALNFYIFISQLVSVSVASSPLNYYLSSPGNKLLMTYYGFWNLDFFCYIIPPFCVSHRLTTIHILSLDYIVAIYPLILVVVTYTCIELHDKNYKVLVCLWKPFHRCFTRFRRKWDPKASVIHAFATFILLSFSKLIFVSSNLLSYTRVYNSTGERVGPLVLYYNASMTFLSNEHMPFFLLAIFVLAIFVAPPTVLLLLYQTRLFQKCLSHCGVRWHPLHIFADAFQGCYKNGTNGTHDCRYFAGLYLIFRFIYITLFIFTGFGDSGLTLGIVFSMTASLLFSLLRPYKNKYFNIFDSLNFALLGLALLLTLRIFYGTARIPQALLYLITAIPLLYFTLYLTYRVLLCTGLLERCHQYCKPLWRKGTHHDESCNDIFPARLENMHQYLQDSDPLITIEQTKHCAYGSM